MDSAVEASVEEQVLLGAVKPDSIHYGYAAAVNYLYGALGW